MAATKTKKPAKRTAGRNGVPSATEPNDVMTLAEAAAYLRVSENDVVGAVTTQGLPARMIGGEWRFTKAAILQWMSVSQPTAEMRKAAQLAMAGKYKDDPNLEQIVEDAMRQRGRPIMEDGTYSGRITSGVS